MRVDLGTGLTRVGAGWAQVQVLSPDYTRGPQMRAFRVSTPVITDVGGEQTGNKVADGDVGARRRHRLAAAPRDRPKKQGRSRRRQGASQVEATVLWAPPGRCPDF